MAQLEYPVHMYKNLHAPRYAHDRKSYEAMLKDGWTDIRANAGHQEYPKGMWNEAGESVTVGDYVNGVVDLEMAKAEEARYTRQGYSTKFVAPNAPVPAAAVPVAAEGGSRMDRMEADIAALKSAMAELIQAVQNRMASGGSKKHREPEV